jgi:hypothetical protein
VEWSCFAEVMLRLDSAGFVEVCKESIASRQALGWRTRPFAVSGGWQWHQWQYVVLYSQLVAQLFVGHIGVVVPVTVLVA